MDRGARQATTSMGSQRVRHDWATKPREVNKPLLKCELMVFPCLSKSSNSELEDVNFFLVQSRADITLAWGRSVSESALLRAGQGTESWTESHWECSEEARICPPPAQDLSSLPVWWVEVAAVSGSGLSWVQTTLRVRSFYSVWENMGLIRILGNSRPQFSTRTSQFSLGKDDPRPQWVVHACVCAKLFQMCTTLWDPMDCSWRCSSVHGILQARILEWVAMSSSRRSSWPRGSNPHFLHWQAGSLSPGPPGKPHREPPSNNSGQNRTAPAHAHFWTPKVRQSCFPVSC